MYMEETKIALKKLKNSLSIYKTCHLFPESFGRETETFSPFGHIFADWGVLQGLP
jgi:hypothetical protein